MVLALLWIGVLAVSIYALIKGSNYFINAAEKIGLYFGMPIFIVGATIIALGTSLPEVITSVFSVLKDSSEIVIGNVVGSNIANILLVLGITAILARKLVFDYKFIHIDLPLLVISALLLSVFILDGSLNLIEGLLFIGGIAVYFAYSIRNARKKHHITLVKEEVMGIETRKIQRKTIFVLIGGAFLIYLGANFTIESIIELSSFFNIGKEVIAITAVAIGTSLPELAVSITAIKKKKPEVAIGTLFGSNIFNTFGVMGIAALFGTLVIPERR